MRLVGYLKKCQIYISGAVVVGKKHKVPAGYETGQTTQLAWIPSIREKILCTYRESNTDAFLVQPSAWLCKPLGLHVTTDSRSRDIQDSNASEYENVNETFLCVSLLLHRAFCRFTNYHTTNKCTNCMSFIFKSLF